MAVISLLCKVKVGSGSVDSRKYGSGSGWGKNLRILSHIMNTDASGRNVTFRNIFFHNVNVGSGSVDLDPGGKEFPDPQPHYEYWCMSCELLAEM